MKDVTPKILNDVKKIHLNEYVEFTDYLAKHLISVPQVVSIYQMGGWTQPGISDIDLIVVVKELNTSQYRELNVLNKVLARNSREEYMLMHAPFIITEKAFQNLDLFFYCSDLKKLQGKDIDIIKHPDELQNIAEIYKLASVLIHTYPRFYSFYNKKSLRSFLTFGYSLKHTYRIIKQFDASFADVEIESYIKEVTDLRKKVIESSDIQDSEINVLIEKGIRISKTMIRKVDEIIVRTIPFEPSATDFLYIKNYKMILSFVNGSKSYNVDKRNGVHILELPHSFAVVILATSNNGILSNFQALQTIGKNSLEINEEYKLLFEQIEQPFVEYHKVFKKCRVYNGMSFELNTPLIWDARKYRTFNILDYARRLKHIFVNGRNKIKITNLIKHL